MNFFEELSAGSTMKKNEQNTFSQVPKSRRADNTVNKIRRIVDAMKIEPNPKFDFISLSIGDPTVFGNLNPPEEVVNAVSESLLSGKHNGYGPAIGIISAREAVAMYSSTPGSPLTKQDVILTSGCSHALEMSIQVLAGEGDNILLPRPGFSIYNTLIQSEMIECKYYKLLPEKQWEADIDHMESLIDAKTKCILVNNPSNPCGSVYSKEHLIEILNVAEKYRLPIIADEIYAYSVFKDEVFYPIASLTKTVPVLSVGAISKRFLVPGWRLGWILIHDQGNALSNVRKGLFDLATKLVGPNSIIQGALPAILSRTPESFFNNTMNYIERNAEICFLSLSVVPGLNPVKPRGAMYMMVGINEELMKLVENDLGFTQKLVATKSVFCLPGSCFDYPNFFRIVLTAPEELTRMACERIGTFCRELLEGGETNGVGNGVEL